MKIRAIGTGSAFCRHPLVTSSFLIQSENSNVLIGCGPNIPAKLETINLSLKDIDMYVLLNAKTDHSGGLEEVVHARDPNTPKPFLVAPSDVLATLEERGNPTFYPSWKEYFEVRAVNKITVNEEHFTETLSFVKTYLKAQPTSYGLFLEASGIYISGTAELNEEFLHRHGMPADLILHQCMTPGSVDPKWFGMGASLEDLQTLPIYLQKKIWLYGYGNDYSELEEPLPMIFLPQGSCVFDSERKDKHLEKERFIRENTRRQMGNLTAAPVSSLASDKEP